MSNYRVEIKEHALHDLNMLMKNEPKSYQKALSLINELYDHPRTGTGKPEQLKVYVGVGVAAVGGETRLHLCRALSADSLAAIAEVFSLSEKIIEQCLDIKKNVFLRR